MLDALYSRDQDPFPFPSLETHLRRITATSNTANPDTVPEHHLKRRDSFFNTDTDEEDPTPPSKLDLLSLPPEILLVLASHLPTPSRVSLRFTCRTFQYLIPRPRVTLEDNICLRTAVYRHLDERSDIAAGKRRCALCKALYSESQFRRARIIDPEYQFENFSAAQAGSERGKENELEELPSTRICAWHINRFIFPPSAALYPDPTFDALVTAAAAGKECGQALAAKVTAGGWASSVEQVCMHCGRLVVCTCTVVDCGICACDCDSCGVRKVRCWWKLARVGKGVSPEASFARARRAWLTARAEDMDCFGWDGMVVNAGGVLGWGLVRVAKCANSRRREEELGMGQLMVMETSTYLRP